jgi:hypothetical protein
MTTLSEEILLKLKVIGQLANHGNIKCKLNVRHGKVSLAYPDTFTCFSRWLRGECQESTVKFIGKTLNHCEELTFLYLYKLDNKDQHSDSKSLQIMLNQIADELQQTAKGIDCLKTTYEKNCYTVASLEIQKLKTQKIVEQISKAIV